MYYIKMTKKLQELCGIFCFANSTNFLTPVFAGFGLSGGLIKIYQKT